MSGKVQQLCQTIAKHPSKINLLNEALSLMLAKPDCGEIALVIELMTKMGQKEDIAVFLSRKVTAVFMALLEMKGLDDQELKMSLLEKCYNISRDKTTLILEFQDFAMKNDVEWGIVWPVNVLAGLFEHLSALIEKEEQIQWDFVVEMILGLPDMASMEIVLEEEALSFKKSFQRLIISVIASKKCSQDVLIELYHGLGSKVISKMSQPLALSNHCINLFAQSPQIQIEILSCLFLLVGKYGLELEEFYPKLQKLIQSRDKTRSVYELPNSKRFFKLLEAALRSSRVPFKTVSAFVHILIRQLPGQMGQFAFWSLSFIVNLTKKHRKLLDYVPHLPQIRSLKHHYSNKVKKLAGQLFKNLNKIDYLEIEDFTKVNLKELSQKKMVSALNSLDDDELEFKVPIFEEAL